MAKSISIVIATSGRIEKVKRLLEALYKVEGRERIDHEVVIANNAPDDAKARAVEALVHEFANKNGASCWQVREPVPGKCRAQNKTIPQTKGAIVAFLDDDVEVTAGWLQAIDAFFKSYPHDAMQGAVMMRPEDRQNEQLQKLLYRYRTVDFIEYGLPPGADLKTLTGGNIAVKREVFDEAGLFDERLGPGGYGISEDVEFAKRILRIGKRIGWEPKAAVYNELDASRFTEEAFRLRHEQQGRSRLAYKRNSIFTIVPNLMRALWTFVWYSLAGDQRKKYRAKGRYFHYRAMLVEKTKTMRGIQDWAVSFLSSKRPTGLE